jgi:hypothetical protein
MSTRSYQHKTSLRASSNGHARLTGSGIALCLLMQCTCDCRTLASFLHDGFIPAEHHSSNTPRSTESLETLVQSLKVTRGYKLCDFRETGDACTLCDAQRQLKRDGERPVHAANGRRRPRSHARISRPSRSSGPGSGAGGHSAHSTPRTRGPRPRPARTPPPLTQRLIHSLNTDPKPGAAPANVSAIQK